MSCYDHKSLARYVENDLPAPKRAAVDDHLRACAACRAAVEALNASWRALGSLEQIQPPRDFAARVSRRIDAAAVRPFPTALILAAAAVILIGLGLVIFLKNLDSSPLIDPSHQDDLIKTGTPADPDDNATTTPPASVDTDPGADLDAADLAAAYLELFADVEAEAPAPTPVDLFLSELADIASLDQIEREAALLDILFPIE